MLFRRGLFHSFDGNFRHEDEYTMMGDGKQGADMCFEVLYCCLGKFLLSRHHLDVLDFVVVVHEDPIVHFAVSRFFYGILDIVWDIVLVAIQCERTLTATRIVVHDMNIGD